MASRMNSLAILIIFALTLYTPCVRGYAPPTKKWQNYWSNPKSKCLKAFVNFLKEEFDSWSKSKFSVTLEAQMKATFCTLNAELLKLFRNDKVFTICLRIWQDIMKKLNLCLLKGVWCHPWSNTLILHFNNQVRVDTFSNASQLKLQRSICFAIYLEFPLAFRD